MLKRSKLTHTNMTFMALLEAMIPEAFDLSQKQNRLSDAAKHGIDEYQIWELNHSLSQTMFNMVLYIRLAKPTAKLLDKAARQLIKNAGNKEPINHAMLRNEGTFAMLEHGDRLRAIYLLEQLNVNRFSLPLLFFVSPGLVLSIINTVIMLTAFGYFSEWFGYGSTSLEPPEKRTIEYFPPGWKHAGYPGPSKGYHAFKGYLIDEFTD